MVKKLITAVICVALGGAVFVDGGEAAGKKSESVTRGRTAQGRRIRVAFHRAGVELKRFTIRLRCGGGYVLFDEESGFQPSPLLRHGRIHDHQVGSTDDVYIRGRLGNHRLHGAIRVRDKLGRYRCDSRWVRFNVQR